MNCEGTLSLNKSDKVSVSLYGDFYEIKNTKTNSFEGLLYKRLLVWMEKSEPEIKVWMKIDVICIFKNKESRLNALNMRLTLAVPDKRLLVVNQHCRDMFKKHFKHVVSEIFIFLEIKMNISFAYKPDVTYVNTKLKKLP